MFKSLYPSCILQFNIAPNTQIGYIDIPEQVYDNENTYHLDKYSRGGEFIENLTSDNLLEFSHRWLHLAGFKEFLEDWAEYNQLRKVQYSSVPMYGIYGKKDGKLALCPVVSAATPTRAVSFNKTHTVPIVVFNTRKETA